MIELEENIMNCFAEALSPFRGSSERWNKMRASGATDEDLCQAIVKLFHFHMLSGGPGKPWYACDADHGRPQFWFFGDKLGHPKNVKPTLQGMKLIKLARQVLKIPYPPPPGQVRLF